MALRTLKEKAILRAGRRGIPKTMTLTPEANRVLQVLAPHSQSYGSFVSGLLLNEMSRRIELRNELQRIEVMMGLSPGTLSEEGKEEHQEP